MVVGVAIASGARGCPVPAAQHAVCVRLQLLAAHAAPGKEARAQCLAARNHRGWAVKLCLELHHAGMLPRSGLGERQPDTFAACWLAEEGS